MTFEQLKTEAAKLKTWLNTKALPLWWRAGYDHEHGGFFETVALNGTPTSINRRARVQPRQIYCYTDAGLRGWQGPWKEAVAQTNAYFDKVYRLENGTYGAIASHEGKLIDPSFDLYNQAFALFAMAQCARAMPESASEFSAKAVSLLGYLKANFANSIAGFEEANPRQLPLCSNPHMHLFETCLAWEELGGETGAAFKGLGDEIGALCLSYFMDSKTGAIREFFDGNWVQYQEEIGRTVEPGHQFEWAWLLVRWGCLRGRDDALVAARRLFDIAETYGLCDRRGVAIMALNDDFSPRDPLARMWPQTEWLKASIRLALISKGAEQARFIASAHRAVTATWLFLDVELEGLWRDKLREDGTFIQEAAPTSTFYHIVSAIHELEDGLKHLS